jgi:AraC family transcriptional regulator
MILKAGMYCGAIGKSFENSNLKISTTRHPGKEYIGLHQHVNPYLSILIKGSYREYAGGQQYELSPGHIIFRPPYTEHAEQMLSQDCVCCNIELKSSFFDALAIPDLRSSGMIFIPGQFEALNRILYSFANNIFSYENDLISWAKTMQVKSNEISVVEETKQIIRENINEKYHLESIAAKIYKHPIYIARLFKSSTGFTMGQYYRKVKVERSYQLLLNTDLSIASIAYELNFFDTAHFVKVFRQHYNVSPQHFRSSVKKLI